MNVAFIGGGRAGTSFAKVLQESEQFNIKAVTCLTSEEAENSGKFIGNVEYIGTDNSKAVELSDIIFITTPDDIIKKVSDILSKTTDLRNKYMFHISGSLSSEILSESKKKGAFTGSIHPLQSLPSFEQGRKNIKKAYFCIEGDKKAVETAKKIIATINDNFFTIDSKLKGLYHAAAVFASNYINTTCFTAYSIFKKLGIKEEDILDMLKPLILGTINNIEQLGFIQSLTGPISRADINTVRNHLNSFTNYDREDLALYRELGKKTVELSILKDKEKQEEIIEIEKLLLNKIN